MGDRIAILREGGDLVQYDTPAEILSNPADEFVAQFVGADRGLKRLALTTLSEITLEQSDVEGDATNRQTISTTDTLRNALSMIMTDSMRPLRVVDENGQVAGYVSIELINRSLRRDGRAGSDDRTAVG
jgi:osmoprotectant transport system ATP-binding protein